MAPSETGTSFIGEDLRCAFPPQVAKAVEQRGRDTDVMRYARRRAAAGLVCVLLAGLACADAGGRTGPNTPPQRLRIVSGDNQISLARRALLQPIVVQALSPAGTAEPLVPVTFAVVSGGSYLSLSGATTAVNKSTDASGLASVPWVIGAAIGPLAHQVVVTRPGVEGSVTFTATGVVGAPVALSFVTNPSLVAYNVVPNPEITVAIVDEVGSVVSASSPTIVTISSTTLVRFSGVTATTLAGVASFPNFRITCSSVGTTSPVTFTTTAGSLRGSTGMRVSGFGGPSC
jgi:hypothetical protein